MSYYRTLRAGQRSQIWIGGPEQSSPELIYESDDLLIEAPNWSLDGGTLFLNGHGHLWRFALDSPGRGLTRVEFAELPELNNDHVLDPDGVHIYLSAMDRHIYRGALTGGAVQRVSPDDGCWHYLHGVSPDGARLAYVQLVEHADPGRLAILTLGGSASILDTGAGHLDGPEWSPDGAYLYFNTESFTGRPGHAQLGRMPDGGGPAERLVSSRTVDWFPHLSPDGTHASYIAFPPGTLGHPADLDVEVRIVSTTDWSDPRQRYPLFGGQGTLNVNSWSPDSTRIAFVAYPSDELVSQADRAGVSNASA
jgi:Tol biopolymer transport system component